MFTFSVACLRNTHLTHNHTHLRLRLLDFMHRYTHIFLTCSSNQPKVVILLYLLFLLDKLVIGFNIWTPEPWWRVGIPKGTLSCISPLQYYSVLGMLGFQRSETHMLCIYRQFLVCMWNLFYMDHSTSDCVRASTVVFLELWSKVREFGLYSSHWYFFFFFCLYFQCLVKLKEHRHGSPLYPYPSRIITYEYPFFCHLIWV